MACPRGRKSHIPDNDRQPCKLEGWGKMAQMSGLQEARVPLPVVRPLFLLYLNTSIPLPFFWLHTTTEYTASVSAGSLDSKETGSSNSGPGPLKFMHVSPVCPCRHPRCGLQSNPTHPGHIYQIPLLSCLLGFLSGVLHLVEQFLPVDIL